MCESVKCLLSLLCDFMLVGGGGDGDDGNNDISVQRVKE